MKTQIMTRTVLAFLILNVLLSSAEAQSVDIFVALGQSNMAGRAAITGEVTDVVSGALLLDDNDNWVSAQNPFNEYSNIRKDISQQQVGPSYSFAKAMVKHTGNTIGMVVNARGGTRIQKFTVGGEYHDDLISRITGLNTLGTVKGILWHQGEGNRSSSESTYMTHLDNLVDALRGEVGNVRFVAGQMGGWTLPGETAPKYENINNIIGNIRNHITNSTYVKNNNLTDFDGSHFDLPSQLLLGHRYAQKMLKLEYGINVSILKLFYDGAEELTVNGESLRNGEIRSITELKEQQSELIFDLPNDLELVVDGTVAEAIGNNQYRVILTPQFDEVSLEISTNTILTFDDFESGWGSYTDGGSDTYLYSGSDYAYSGSAAANIQDNSGIASAFYHASSDGGYDITEFDQVRVDFHYIAKGMESGEQFRLRYHNGSVWNNIGIWTSGVDFENEEFVSVQVFISSSDRIFPTNARFRFQCEASGNADDIYIDDIQITGIKTGQNNSSRKSDQVTDIATLEEVGDISTVTVFPNPSSDLLRIKGSFEDQDFQMIQVFSMNGDLHYQESVELSDIGVLDFRHNIQSWSRGLYIIQIGSGENVQNIRFLKK